MSTNNDDNIIKIGNVKYSGNQFTELVGRYDDSSDSDWDDIEQLDLSEFVANAAPKKDAPKRKFGPVDDEKAVENKPLVMPGVFGTKSAESVIQKTVAASDVPLVKKVKEGKKYFIARPTRIRVIKPQLTDGQWSDCTEGKKICPVSDLYRNNSFVNDTMGDNWVLLGVVVQTAGKATKNDKQFCAWLLSDLQDVSKAARVMLFGRARDAFWKEPQSAVVAIFCPKPMPNDNGYADKAFVVNDATQIIVLGRSPDIGVCEAVKKNGDKCRNVVNKNECSYCTYHLTQGYFKAAARPGFTNIAVHMLNERKRLAENQQNHFAKRMQVDPSANASGVLRPKLSIEKLQQTGVANAAVSWGVFDSDKLSVGYQTQSTAAVSQKETVFATMLKKPSAGSVNFVKQLVAQETGAGPALPQASIMRKKLEGTGPTKSSNISIVDFMEKFKENRVNLGRKPSLSENVAEQRNELDELRKRTAGKQLSQAEQNRIRATEMVAASGGYSSLAKQRRAERLNMASSSAKQTSSEKIQRPPLSADLLATLHQGSVNSDLVDIDKTKEIDRLMDRMVREEQVRRKLEELHEEKCVLFVCAECKVRYQVRPRFCMTQGHSVTTQDGVRRYFRCIKCQHRASTIDIYPAECCMKCGEHAFERAGKWKEQTVPMAKPSIDGGEKKWLKQ